AAPLVVVGDAAPRPSPAPTSLIQRVVVDGLHLVKECRQKVLLLLGWAEPVLVRANHLAALLFVNVPLNRSRRDMPCRTDEVAARPQVRQTAIQFGELAAQHMRSIALDPMHHLVGRNRGWNAAKQMNVVGL